MKIGDYIKQYREEHGLSARGFASLVGISPQYVVNLESGYGNTGKPCTPTVRILAKIAEGTGISESELFSILDGTVALNPPGLMEKYKALDARGRARVDRILEEEYLRCTTDAPIYIRHYLVPAAAGATSPVAGEEYEDIPLPDGAPAGADFCITVDGGSMEPWIHDGSLAYVKRGADMQELDVGVFYVDGDVLIKQWRRDQEGTLHLLSANPKRQDANRSIPRSSTSTVICFGKVLLDHKLPAPVYD